MSQLGSVLIQPSQRGKLVLADGIEAEGYSFGAATSIAGEVVFNTGMVGYPEALTDPSYAGQILVLTYPMVGNYGVPDDTKDEYGLPHFFESDKIQIAGLIVVDYSVDFSHWNAVKSLGQWLTENGIPALFGVDTRRLTKRLRESGAVLGKIEFEGQPVPFYDPNTVNLVASVSTKQAKTYGQGQSPHIIAFDCGIKYNIIRQFIYVQKVCLTVVPFDYDLQANPLQVTTMTTYPTTTPPTLSSLRTMISVTFSNTPCCCTPFLPHLLTLSLPPTRRSPTRVCSSVTGRATPPCVRRPLHPCAGRSPSNRPNPSSASVWATSCWPWRVAPRRTR